MTVTLEQMKDHLRVTQSHQDDDISVKMAGALADLKSYAGDNFDPDSKVIDLALLLLTEYHFDPSEKTQLDSITGWPMAVASLMRPFRLPTLA